MYFSNNSSYFLILWGIIMKKRGLSLVLALCMLFCMAVMPAHAAKSGTCGNNVNWTLDDEGTLTISGVGGYMSDYRSASSPWFGSRTSIKTVIIEDSISRIGAYAFWLCDSITSITIGGNVRSIGEGAFCFCSALTNITIPDSVWSIGSNAFNGCRSLTSITIGNSVTSIGDSAFKNCSDLTGVIIPNSVTSIGGYAFFRCSSLTSITIPYSVTSIGYYAFRDCSNLTAINVSENNEVYSSKEGVFFDKNKTNLIQCPGGKTGAYTIPNSVISIGMFAFSECNNLTSIVVSDNVTSIACYAFFYCSHLISITISNSVTNIEEDAFRDCSSLTDIYYVGTEEDWNKISIGGENDELKNASHHYIPSIKLTAYGSSFTVTPKNIATGNSIMFAVYKDGKMVDMQTKSYDGENSVFSITVPYDTVKAMVWENLTSMEPLCPLKTISQ